MTREWINAKYAEQKRKLDTMHRTIVEKIRTCGFITPDERRSVENIYSRRTV